MKARLRKPLLYFFIIITVFIIISVYEAYSVYITISEVEPLPRRGSIQYSLSKTGSQYLYVEVRSVSLNLINSYSTVDSATVNFYFYNRFLLGYYVDVSVVLRDDDGNPISQNSVTLCLRLSREYTVSIDLPNISVDSFASVDASASIDGICWWRPPWPPEPFESLDSGGEYEEV